MVICDAESLGYATGTEGLGSLGPSQGLAKGEKGAIFSSRCIKGNGSEWLQPGTREAGEKVGFFCRACPLRLAHTRRVTAGQKHTLTGVSSGAPGFSEPWQRPQQGHTTPAQPTPPDCPWLPSKAGGGPALAPRACPEQPAGENGELPFHHVPFRSEADGSVTPCGSH